MIQLQLLYWGINIKENEQECPGLNVDEKILKYLTPSSVNKMNEMKQAREDLSPAERSCMLKAEDNIFIAAQNRTTEVLADSGSIVTDVCDEFINQWQINTIPELEKACNEPSAALRTIALEWPESVKNIFSPLKGTAACDASTARAMTQ
ncbi:unnamed protein product [Owenia fusiformis]|uniref:Uncharacterized protein n=1 Tax=Owenia fusiformis TaxID=6347 RepID=A0A8J1U8X7_OWEFU|nr:unnamed protein product [Owenia fusiformis]